MEYVFLFIAAACLLSGATLVVGMLNAAKQDARRARAFRDYNRSKNASQEVDR